MDKRIMTDNPINQLDTPLPLDDLALETIPNGQELYTLIRTSALLVLRSRADMTETSAHNIASRIAERTVRERNRSRIESLKKREDIKRKLAR